MSPRTSLIVLVILAVAALVPAAAQTAGETAWDAAMTVYKAGDLEAALRRFDEFRAGFPDDPKADDALWFMGRIHAKAGRPAEAERSFLALMALPFRSNRHTEAAYDLAKLQASLGLVDDAIGLLESVERSKNLASEDRRVLRLLAGLEGDRAASYRKEYREAEAREGWQRAIALYDQLLVAPADDKDRLDDLTSLGGVWADVAEAAPDRTTHETARANALGAWSQALVLAAGDPGKARLEAGIGSLERGPVAALTGTLEAFGGGAPVSIPSSSYAQWGGVGSADLTFTIPAGWQQELRLGLTGGHDSFSLKTSGFTAAEQAAGAVRIIQRVNDLGISLGWHAGSRHLLHSELEVSGAWSPAEDLGDTSIGFAVDERLDWRPGPQGKLSLDLGFTWEAWPDDLLVMSRELDRWEASVNPKATWYALTDLALDAGYAFTFRQYLNAVYAPDTLGKQYLVHEADLGVRWTPGSAVRLSLDYAFRWNDTRRYTTTVYGPGALVVADYYDYLEHAGKLKVDLRWSPDLRTAASASGSLQDFVNYPARDAAKIFTGAMRSDWNLGLDAEAAWRFWPAKANGFADLWAVLAATFDTNGSNNTWEDAIQTNYQKLKVYTGVRAELP